MPNSRSKKADLLQFCQDQGLPDELLDGATRQVLWDHCKNILDEDPQLEIEELAREKGIILLRLPPYHPDLNPIEMI